MNLVKALKMNPSNPDAKRELSRLAGEMVPRKRNLLPKKKRKKEVLVGSLKEA